MKKMSIYKICAIGLMGAVAFISNFFSIPIGDVTRFHLGNGFCVISGIILGPLGGGIAAGLGGFFFDLFNPLYARGAIVTFCMKFVIGFVAGLITKKTKGNKTLVNFIAAVCASLSYCVLYLSKSFITDYFYYRTPIEAVTLKLMTKAGATLTNAVAAVIVTLILTPVFIKAMKSAGIYDKLNP